MSSEQIQQQILEQQSVIIQLQQQLQALQQQAGMQQEINRQTVEAAISAISKQQAGNLNNNFGFAKIAKPSIFNGSVRANVELWLFEMNSYLNGVKVPDNQKVQVAGTYLKDNAALWFKCVCEEANADEVLLTWEDFKDKLLQRFRPIESNRTARVALSALKQTGSVQYYCNQFQQLITLINDMAEADKVFAFQRGLKFNIAREVDLREPNTLLDAMNFAIRADARNNLLFKRSVFNIQNYNNRFQENRTPPMAPMEVDNINGGDLDEENSTSVNAAYVQRLPQGKRIDINETDRDRCMRERRCFNCKKVGHTNKQCRSTYSKNF